MIIDFHTHCFPEKIVAKAISTLIEQTRMTAYLHGTVGDLRHSMEKANIDYSVLLPIATKPEQTVSINRWVTSLKDKKIITFGTIHPDFDDWRSEVKWLAEAGIKGVKFHSDYQGFLVDDKKMFPIYEALFEEGLMILFHAGVDFGFENSSTCTPERLRNIINTFQGGKVIAAHMGGLLFWNEVEEFLVGRDIYFDTSHSFERLGEEGMERIIKNHGTDKILFATDSPWKDQNIEVKRIESININEEEKSKILSGNARLLLGI